MSTTESKVMNIILRTLRPNKNGLTYNTIFSHLDYTFARMGNDKLWGFAVGKDGAYSVARHMVTQGLLYKTDFAKPNRVMRLTGKGQKLADKLL